MTKPVIVTRAGKGSALTFTEGDSNFTNLRDATITVSDGTTSTAIDLNGTITFAAGSGISVDESSGTITITNTAGAASVALDDLTDVAISTPSTGQVLSYGAGGWANGAVAIQYDTAPVLGGNLDVNGNSIVSISNGNITLAPNGTGKTKTNNINYYETPYAIGSNDSPSINVANGNVQTVTITSGLSLPAFTSAITGQSVTLIVSGSGTASGTAAYKFAGGNTTLTSYSVVSIFYDGTTYWTSIATDFQ